MLDTDKNQALKQRIYYWRGTEKLEKYLHDTASIDQWTDSSSNFSYTITKYF